MKENLYKDYYNTHWYSEKEVNYKESEFFFKYNYDNIFNKIDKNIKILEIWSWQWKFAYYLKNKWFKNYIWLDLDKNIINETKEKYKNYEFYNISALEYLKNKIEEFDIIYMSHVFEHFTLEEWIELSKLINASLKKWWLWINEMPNAQSIYYASYWRYNDITHKIIYTPNSFNQVLLKSWFKRWNLIHKNEYIWTTLKNKIIHKFFIFIHKILILWMWLILKEPYTFNLVSIIKKDDQNINNNNNI